MSIKITNALTAHRAVINQNAGGSLDILGSFDEIIQPVFPVHLQNMSIVLFFEGLEKNTMFKIRLNSPNDELIFEGEFGVARGPFGKGKKIIDTEKFLVRERGIYTLDIFEIMNQDGEVKFVQSCELFNATYPPQRIFAEGEIDAILSAGEEIIKTIKTDFKPLGVEQGVKFQLNLDPKAQLEEGHLEFPSNNEITIEDKVYDLTGLKRHVEWLFGRQIPSQNPANTAENTSKEDIKEVVAETTTEEKSNKKSKKTSKKKKK